MHCIARVRDGRWPAPSFATMQRLHGRHAHPQQACPSGAEGLRTIVSSPCLAHGNRVAADFASEKVHTLRVRAETRERDRLLSKHELSLRHRRQRKFVRAAREELTKHYSLADARAHSLHIEQLSGLEGRPFSEVDDLKSSECQETALNHIHDQLLKLERNNKALDSLYSKIAGSDVGVPMDWLQPPDRATERVGDAVGSFLAPPQRDLEQTTGRVAFLAKTAELKRERISAEWAEALRFIRSNGRVPDRCSANAYERRLASYIAPSTEARC